MSSSNVNSRAVTVFILVAVGLIVAFNAGNWIADENYTPIALIFAGLLGALAFFGLGKIGYLLIPICYGLTGQISVLPLPFSVRQLVILLCTLLFISRLIFKAKNRQATHEFIDFLLWLNVAYLGIVFFRNPVGVNALGSELVGGKPYVDFMLGVMSYLILSRCIISPKEAGMIVRWSLGLSVAVGLMCTAVFFVPAIGKVLGKFYSEFSSWGMDENADISVGESRLTPLQGGGVNVVLFCVSNVNPMKFLSVGNLRFFWMYLIGIVMILLSGFRSAIFNVFLITSVAAIVREKIVGGAKIIFASGLVASLFVVLSMTHLNLPLTAQRALCFLPGNWDPDAVRAAEVSSEWRYHMWDIMMSTDYYIRSKLWGDGYGFTRKELEIMMDAGQGGGGFGGEDAHIEAHLIQGTVHSGPISSIKRVGYVGLGLLIIFMGGLSLYAYRTIKSAQATKYELIAYYFALPTLITPFIFIFIFGDYNDITTMMFELGMLKMISASLAAKKTETLEIAQAPSGMNPATKVSP